MWELRIFMKPMILVVTTISALLASSVGSPPANAADPACTINVSESNVTIQGTNLGDVICITGDNNLVSALGGDDTVIDDGLDNTVNLGEGFDIYDGSGGDGSTVDGGPGEDNITGTPGEDELTGGDGDDTLIGGEEDDTLNGGLGGDELVGNAGDDTINGEAGNDTANGGDGADLINGGDGDDSLIGATSNDTLNGGLGADNLAGDAGDDEIFGESGADNLLGGVGNDLLAGGSDIDSISGGEGLNTCDYESGELLTSTCLYDDEAPTVTNATVEPSTLDSTSATSDFAFTFNVKDQIGLKEGVLLCQLTVTNGLTYEAVGLHFDGKTVRNSSKSSTVLTSSITGLQRDLNFNLSMQLRTGMYPGEYQCSLSVTDLMNKSKLFRPFNLSVTRGEGVFDDAPPVVIINSITPNPIDSSLGDSELTIRWQADDPNDSVGQVQCVQAKNGTYYEAVNLAWWDSGYVMDYSGGPGAFAENRTSTHTEFTARVKIPKDFQPGTYVCGGRQTDKIGNTTYSYPLGSFEITNSSGVYDQAAPQVSPDLSNSQSLEVGAAGATVSLGWDITDETSYSWGYVSCVSKTDPNSKILDGVTNASSFYDYGNRSVAETISGTKKFVRYDITFDVPLGSKPGRYLCQGNFTDSLGNWGSTSLGEIVVNRTPAGQPTSPVNLDFFASKPTVGVLTWSSPDSLGSPALATYLTEYSLNGLVWKELEMSATQMTSLNVSGLEADKDYWFRVRGDNGGTAGQDTTYMNLNWATIQVRTPAPLAADAPAELVVSNVTSNGYKLSWSAPSYNGGSEITDFKVEVSRDSGDTWELAKQFKSTSLSLNVSGAAPGTNYLVRVAGVNGVGLGEFLFGSLKTLASAPLAPRSITSSEVSATSLTLSWLLPSSNGGLPITDYKVEVSSNGGSVWTTIEDDVSTNLAVDVSNLLKNRSYLFRVSALNSAGLGLTSDEVTVKTLATTPSSPLSLEATDLQSNSVVLGWSAPVDFGGVPITDYKIETSRDGISWVVVPDPVSLTRSLKLSGLAPGTTYQTRISALSGFGQSEPLSGSFTTLLTAPNIPTSLSSSSVTSSSLTLSWLLPSSNGGSAITDYKVEVSSNCSTYKAVRRAASVNLGFKVTGLSAGTKYCFRVSSRNGIGYSAPTKAIEVLTRGYSPSAPTSLSVKAAKTSVVLGWKAAAVTGGSPVRNYLVEYSKNDGVTWLKVVKPVSTSRSLVASGLKSKTTYLFRVTAVNDVGNSPASKSLKVVTG